jgi:hypothetical protein
MVICGVIRAICMGNAHITQVIHLAVSWGCTGRNCYPIVAAALPAPSITDYMYYKVASVLMQKWLHILRTSSYEHLKTDRVSLGALKQAALGTLLVRVFF